MLDPNNVVVQFSGHGIWGVGGVAPDDGVYHGTLTDIEYRTSRRDATAKPKLYWTVLQPSGYKLFDFASLPSPAEKPGVEKAFVRFLCSAGVIPAEKIEAVSAGGMKGAQYKLADLITALNGRGVTVHYLRPRGQGDRHQTTYLYGDEEQKLAAGEYKINDSRAPMAQATATPAASTVVLPTAGATGAPQTATPPTTAPPVVQPPVQAQPAAGSAEAAVGNLLNL